MSLFHFLVGVAAEKLKLAEVLEPFHAEIGRQAEMSAQRRAREYAAMERGSAAVLDGVFASIEQGKADTAKRESMQTAFTKPETMQRKSAVPDIAPRGTVETELDQPERTKPEAVLLLAHGTPDTLGEMDAYLKLVTGGRGVPPHVVHELQERYAEIGLREEPTEEGPHLTRWTLLQGRRLAEALGVPVYVGMRNWKPFIGEVVAQMKADGVRSATTLCLAPQNSRTSVGLYKRAVETAAGEELRIDFLAGWAEHPLLARAFAETMRVALDKARATGARTAVLFTAHSVPCRTVQASVKPVEHHGMVLATEPDTYNRECKMTAERIAAELGVGGSQAGSDPLREEDWFFCFQSQGLSGGPWIGPSVEDTLAALQKEGYEHVVMQPVGFLCDHVEILYDIDIAFQQTAKEVGVVVSRAESLNDSPTLIAAIEDIVLRGYAHATPKPVATGAAEVVRLLTPLPEAEAVTA